MTRALPTGSYYWTLPREFLGEWASLFYETHPEEKLIDMKCVD